MNNNYTYEDMLEEQDYCPIELDDSLISTDNRVWKSNVNDIKGGDNFADFCEEFFELLDEEGYWDN